MNHPIIFLDRDNKTKLVPASFSFFLENSCGRKININLKRVIVINNRFNLSIVKELLELLYLHCSSKKVAQKSNKENLKVIRNTLPNKSGNVESLKK